MIKDYLEEHREELKPWLLDNQQGRVEIKVLPYLQHIDKGFFVEAGALDGLFMSNTKILEDLGWDGILIEPSKKAAKRCRKHRKVAVEECALVAKDYSKKVITGDFVLDGEYGLGAWSSVNRSTYGQREGTAFKSFITPVEARTLSSILKKHKVKKVDLLSLDVEGYELNVLKGVDFDEVDISFILVEVNLSDYSLQEMDNLLFENGYRTRVCLSNFAKESNPGWSGSHQDYLYSK